MPASVQRPASCAYSLRVSSLTRPTPTSLRPCASILARRQQLRHFRPRWASPWDSNRWRQHRVLLQRYARLRGELLGPQLDRQYQDTFTPLIQEALKLDKWARDLEQRLFAAPPTASRTHLGPDSWSGPWRVNTAPIRTWGYHYVRFQSNGCSGRPGEAQDNGSSSVSEARRRTSAGPAREKDNPSAVQKGNVRHTSTPEPEYSIDPVTNKRVARSEMRTSTGDAATNTSKPVEPGPSTASDLGAVEPEGEGHAGDVSSTTSQSAIRIHPHVSEGPSPDTPVREGHKPLSAGLPKNGEKDAEAAGPISKAPSAQGGLPPSTEETPTNTITQDGTNQGQMTGNYVKDFPEDFAESWEGRYRSEEPASAKEAPAERLEPALDRIRGQATGEEDAPSTASKKVDHDSLVEEIRAIYEDSQARNEDQQPARSTSFDTDGSSRPSDHVRPLQDTPAYVDYSSPEQQTTIYKILVYDPEEGTISTADASSSAPDDAEVLTPSEVVTRLTNPALFLPHFSPLQAQGYEVVSGTGNILVFRKTRAAAEPGMVFLRGSRCPPVPDSSGPASSSSAPAVNPIDMTGSEPVIPTVGNFASPTGYVSYGDEEPAEGDQNGGLRKKKPPPPFRAEYDGGRRVGDSQSTGAEGRGKRTGGALWRAGVGAAWVAGLAYGGSVINDYFKTGGEGGQGSRGLL